MAQATAKYVGCSVEHCSGTYVVCNYDRQNVLNQAIYAKGTACKQCTSCEGSLCKTRWRPGNLSNPFNLWKVFNKVPLRSLITFKFKTRFECINCPRSIWTDLGGPVWSGLARKVRLVALDTERGVVSKRPSRLINDHTSIAHRNNMAKLSSFWSITRMKMPGHMHNYLTHRDTVITRAFGTPLKYVWNSP